MLDMESVLRLISMAQARKRRDLVAALLKKAADDRNKVIACGDKDLPNRLPTSLADFYSEVMKHYDRGRQHAAIQSINALISAWGAKPK